MTSSASALIASKRRLSAFIRRTQFDRDLVECGQTVSDEHCAVALLECVADDHRVEARDSVHGAVRHEVEDLVREVDRDPGLP